MNITEARKLFLRAFRYLFEAGTLFMLFLILVMILFVYGR